MGRNLCKVEVLAGALLASAGGYILYTALQLDYVNEFGPGPGFLPLWLGLGLLALAAIMVALTVAQPGRTRPETAPWTEPLRRGLTAWLAFMVFIAAVDLLGFFLAFTALTFFLAWVLSQRSPGASLIVALGSALAFHIVFAWGLGIALPEGPLGF